MASPCHAPLNVNKKQKIAIHHASWGNDQETSSVILRVWDWMQ
jgi:hypothetical protein